ncbi:MAG: DUF945 family protein [Gammaproteobacteria bacterium]|nr:DUF945 family protein [Gammaproteobacteria bacterium]
MRKSIWVVLILGGVFALSYISVAFYMSKQVEYKLNSLVSTYNSDLLQISVKSFKKSLFKSKATLAVQYDQYNPFSLELNFLHAPILNYTTAQGKSKIYLGKILLNIRVFQEFLADQKEIFANASVIDISSLPIKLDVDLGNITEVLYQIMGIYSFDKTETAGTIHLNKKSINFVLHGNGVNQFTKQNSIKSSKFDVSAEFFTKHIDKQNAQSKILINFSAIDVASLPNGNNDTHSKYKLSLSDPMLSFKFTGDLPRLINIMQIIAQNKIEYKDSISKIATMLYEDDPLEISVNLKNKSASWSNYNKDYLKVENFNQDFILGNTEKSVYIKNNISGEDFVIKSLTEKLDLKVLNLSLNLENDKAADKNFIDFENINIFDFLNSWFTQINTDNHSNIAVDGHLLLTQLRGQGVLMEKLNLDNLNLDFKLDNTDTNYSTGEDDKPPNTILNFNSKLDNFLFNYNNKEFYNFDIKNLSIDSKINLTEYLNFWDNESQDGYNIDLKTSGVVPKVKILYFLDKDKLIFDLNNLLFEMSYKLSAKTDGYFKNKTNLAQLSFGNLEHSVSMKNIAINSDMKQMYKNLLIGKNSMTASEVNSKILINQADNLFAIKDIKWLNSSKFDADKNIFSFGNTINFNNIDYNRVNLGSLIYTDNFIDVSVDGYLKFITQMAAKDFDQATDVNTERDLSSVNADSMNKEESSDLISQFLSMGVKINNTIYLGALGKQKIPQDVTVESDFKVQKFSADNLNLSFLSNLESKSKILLSKSYIERIIAADNNIWSLNLEKQYKNLQTVGLLKFENDLAVININYDNSELKINGKSLEYWTAKLQALKEVHK